MNCLTKKKMYPAFGKPENKKKDWTVSRGNWTVARGTGQ